MAYENNHDFTDWLYNRFVESFKKGNVSQALIYSDTLGEYIRTALAQRKFSGWRRHANQLYKSIIKALKWLYEQLSLLCPFFCY